MKKGERRKNIKKEALELGAESRKKKRVVSGMRPTGKLHIGHYFGALQNWVRLQNDPEYDCFYFIADWHALTSDYADTSAVAQNTIEIVTDYLAAGLDPDEIRHLSAVIDSRTRRTAPASVNGHAAQLARTRSHLQRSL